MNKDKVLIVDDDESMRDMLEVILREDYEVIKAASGEEALKKLSNLHVPLVLLDICRVSVLFPTPVSVLFPTFSGLNYKTHPVMMSITFISYLITASFLFDLLSVFF